jgi:single-stranded-DNA-specific exonuclease
MRGPIAKDSEMHRASCTIFIQSLLYWRGVVTLEAAERFLKPEYDGHIHDPFLMKNMDIAVSRILKAIQANERILIYADYDADGIPSAVILHDIFKKIGFHAFEVYFPHRHEEGFGFHKEVVERYAADPQKKPALIITADCGIADIDAVAEANKHGIDVIITDHHLAHELPHAYAILDPKQDGCEYPDKMLCGAGVVYKLIQGLLSRNRFGLAAGTEKWLLDMVGLSTMADMVPLHGENRVFARFGLLVLRKSPRLGLRALLKLARVDQKTLTEDDVGFMIVPRINAASRMSDPSEAFKLLTTSDEHEAILLARKLHDLNDERKTSAARITKEAKKVVASRFENGKDRIIVVGNPDWKPALLGPVANTLMETYGVPAFVWGGAGDGHVKGSCRSDGVMSVVDIMKAADTVGGGFFTECGGHRASGGFALLKQHVHDLKEKLERAYEEVEKRQGPQDLSHDALSWIDASIALDDVDEMFFQALNALAPFGEGNEKPVFLFKDTTVIAVSQFGTQKNHLKLELGGKGKRLNAIGFFMHHEQFGEALREGEKVHVVASVEKSFFGNKEELRLRIIDIVQ